MSKKPRQLSGSNDDYGKSVSIEKKARILAAANPAILQLLSGKGILSKEALQLEVVRFLGTLPEKDVSRLAGYFRFVIEDLFKEVERRRAQTLPQSDYHRRNPVWSPDNTY